MNVYTRYARMTFFSIAQFTFIGTAAASWDCTQFPNSRLPGVISGFSFSIADDGSLFPNSYGNIEFGDHPITIGFGPMDAALFLVIGSNSKDTHVIVTGLDQNGGTLFATSELAGDVTPTNGTSVTTGVRSKNSAVGRQRRLDCNGLLRLNLVAQNRSSQFGVSRRLFHTSSVGRSIVRRTPHKRAKPAETCAQLSLAIAVSPFLVDGANI